MLGSGGDCPGDLGHTFYHRRVGLVREMEKKRRSEGASKTTSSTEGTAPEQTKTGPILWNPLEPMRHEARQKTKAQSRIPESPNVGALVSRTGFWGI